MAGLRAEYDRLIMSGNVLSKVNLGAAMGREPDARCRRTCLAARHRVTPEVKQKRDRDGAQSTPIPFCRRPRVSAARLAARVAFGRSLVMHGPGMGDYLTCSTKRRHRWPVRASWMSSRKEERASALRAQSLGIARKMLGNGTMTAERERLCGDHAWDGTGGPGERDGLPECARGQRYAGGAGGGDGGGRPSLCRQEEGAGRKQQMLSADRKKLQGQDAANEAVITAKEEQHQDVQAETAERDNLSRRWKEQRRREQPRRGLSGIGGYH